MRKYRTLKGMLEQVFNADDNERRKLLEIFNPELLEWYYKRGYIQ